MSAPGAFDAVVVAASQGGLQAIRPIAAALPADFPAAMVYAQHRSPGSSDAAARLLRRWTALEVRPGTDGTPLEPGTITVPPADAHPDVTADRRLALREGDPGVELGDELFASAARVYGPRLLAVVLTGRLRDGTRGVQAVKAHGGRVIVQDPRDAEQPSMPWNALATGCVDHVLDLPHIADAVVAMVMVPGAADLFGVRASTSGF
jgi:two-component system, chemotaxis family, protein-glutamate methylesterase/glutaminase